MDAIVYDKVGKEAEKVRDALYGIYPQETITDAAIASFDDGADGIPVKALTVEIEPMQAGSGDSSPDNIRPISGWTGVNGQNTSNAQQWDEEWEAGALNTSSGNTIYVENYMRSKNYIPVASGKTYYRAGVYGSDGRAFFYGQDKSFISHTSISTPGAFDIPYNACFMKFHKNGASYSNDISINYPATDTEYHPYTGNQISVAFPSEAGTVYGGALTLNPDRTGTLVVDSAFNEYNGSSDELWAQEGSGTATSYFRISIGEIGTAVDNFVISNLYVKATITVATATIGINVLNSSAYNVSQIMVRPLNVASLTLADFLAQLATTPLQVVYKLASPQTISITAEQVSGILTTLYGTNNIWASTGNIEKLTYRADLGKYIDSHITTAVANALNA